MNKSELIEKIAEEAGISKRAATQALDAALKTISGAIAKGEKVTLMGFGTFKVSTRAAREGRNPRTGETIEIKASKKPMFSPGKSLKAAAFGGGRTGGGGPGKKR